LRQAIGITLSKRRKLKALVVDEEGPSEQSRSKHTGSYEPSRR